MKNNKLKLTLAVLVILPMFALGNPVLADEVTGTLSTGLSSNVVDTTVSGTVMAPPVANPGTGSYTSAQSVSLTASGASSIYYTTDGTNPTCSYGTIYSSPIQVNSSQTINAISCYPQNNSSIIANYVYTINIPVVASNASNGSGGFSSGGGGSSGGNTNTSVTNNTGISGFVLLMANWGQTGFGNPADLNNDGKVDILDFVLLMANWTK